MTETAVSNSYISTIEDFEIRLTGDPRAAAIALLAADSTSQTWYLQKSTQNIDKLNFIGYKYLSTQVLQFPRKFLIDPCEDSPWGEVLSVDAYGYHYQLDIPDEVEQACLEEALSLYSIYTNASPTSEESLQSKGVASFSIGKLSMSFVPGSVNKYGSLHSKEAYDLLVGYIENAPLIV